LTSGTAFAQSETDRLRDALRSATRADPRAGDQRTALQAKVTDADRQTAVGQEGDEDVKAQLKKAEKEHRDAVEEFNQRSRAR